MKRLVHYTFDGIDASNELGSVIFNVEQLRRELDTPNEDGEKGNRCLSYIRSELQYVNDISEKGIEVLENMILVVSTHGHSGSSIHWVTGLLKNMLNLNGWFWFDEETYYDRDYDYSNAMINDKVELFATYDVYCDRYNISKEEREIILKYFANAILFKPLTPLTFEDEEFTEPHCSDSSTRQNKRCSAVFKDNKSPLPYFLDAFIWQHKYYPNWSDKPYELSAFTGHINTKDNIIAIPSCAYIDIEKYKASGDTALKTHYFEVTAPPENEEDYEHYLINEDAFKLFAEESYYIPNYKNIRLHRLEALIRKMNAREDVEIKAKVASDEGDVCEQG